MADDKLHDVCRACLNCETLLSIHDIAQFRIDPPNHDERNFEWHQDFQYNVMSMNSATIWYPLKNVCEEMGPMAVVPGSHRTIVPVEMNFEGHKPGSGLMHAVLRFEVDEREAERKAVVLCPIEEGDIVVFHSLMLHRQRRQSLEPFALDGQSAVRRRRRSGIRRPWLACGARQDPDGVCPVLSGVREGIGQLRR